MRKAIDADPENAKAHVNLASLLHHKLDKLDDAITHYRKALSLYGNYTVARVNLGLRHRFFLNAVIITHCRNVVDDALAR